MCAWRTRRIAWLCLGICVASLGTSLPPALPAEAPSEQTREPAWNFGEGRVEVGVQAGGGIALQHDPRSGTVFAVLPRVGYVFHEVQRESDFSGSFEIVLQPSYLTVFQQKRTAHVGGVATLLKYNLRTRTDFTPFVEAGAGVSYATKRVPPGGTDFNFILQAGVGLQYAISDRHALSFEWLYHHLSNADTGDHNPGFNTGLFLLGYSILY